MGYETDFQIQAGPFETEDEAEFFEFKLSKRIAYSFDGGVAHSGFGIYFQVDIDDVKWYSWQSDLKTVSRQFPDITIDVEGIGEENGDQWKARFRNGVSEVVEAEIRFPDFKRLT